MLFEEKHYKFMYQALTEAEKALEAGEVPVGAVVVCNDKIVGRGYNQTETLKDATAHAEMIALTAAMNHIGEKYLTECDVYVTLEPCLMCTGALKLARVRNLFIGAMEPKFGACGSLYNVAEDGKYNHKLNVYFGLYETESENLLREFFKTVRKKSFHFNEKYS